MCEQDYLCGVPGALSARSLVRLYGPSGGSSIRRNLEERSSNAKYRSPVWFGTIVTNGVWLLPASPEPFAQRALTSGQKAHGRLGPTWVAPLAHGHRPFPSPRSAVQQMASTTVQDSAEWEQAEAIGNVAGRGSPQV